MIPRLSTSFYGLKNGTGAWLWLALAFSLSGCASGQNFLKTVSKVSQDYDAATGMAYGQQSEKPIVNGVEVGSEDTEARAAVLLLITRGSSLHACTGVLVKPKVLLTAAHCVSGVEAKKIRVVFQTRGLAQAESVNDVNPSKVLV
ncbi:MAG: trypsin-like serine protease, partial [Proteobacteria bacterium]